MPLRGSSLSSSGGDNPRPRPFAPRAGIADLEGDHEEEEEEEEEEDERAISFSLK